MNGLAGSEQANQEGMDAKEWEDKLREEGFSNLFVWRDGPNAYYPDHTHLSTTAHIILEGEMTLTVNGKTETFKLGERCDVPANTLHSVRMGRQGCRYLIGEK